MTKIDVEALLEDKSVNETLKKTYQINQREVCISFKKGMVRPDEYYLVERVGKNIRLTPIPPYPVRSHPEDPQHRKVRVYTGRSPCISLPPDCVEPNQLFRVIKSMPAGIIWLLRIDFSYADETSIPPEVIKAL
jgi:hypothetical protein